MIWLIGGTSDANQLAALLLKHQLPILISTTTAYGTKLAKALKCQVIEGQLSETDMWQLIVGYAITAVVDASHPYAACVSEQAIKVCRDGSIPYFRFERATISINGANYYPDYSSLINALEQSSGTILLTIGSKNIHRFSSLRSRLIARILPVSESIDACLKAGLQRHQLLAMKGRVSTERNSHIMQAKQIAHLVSKESGEAGGLREKCEAAAALGVSIHLLARPCIHYPKRFNNMHELINHLKQALNQ